MSNDGNKSTKRAPFTMFSSSAGGGYLDSFHTNFSGGVEINNLHTDIYGNYRNAPAQGPFTEQLVGGLAYRHQEVDTTSDRQEGFLINAETGSISILKTGRVQIYRDAYAKRPLNIRNIKEVSGAFGNYEKEYEVVQIAGRTLNPRHFVEFPEQYTTDYPLHKGTENPVFNALDANGNPQTGSLPDYTLPDMTGSTDQFIFVNKFSSPGDRYTMSRGFLNPKGEEFSVYNASPFRNLNVRAELSADLSRHTPKATDIPPETNTEYHTTNRNKKYIKKSPAEEIQTIATNSQSPVSIDPIGQIETDHSTGKVYWRNASRRILRTDITGTGEVEEVFDLGGSASGFGMALDPAASKIYWIDAATSKIYVGNMDGTGAAVLYTTTASASSMRHLAIDTLNSKLYYTDNTPGQEGVYMLLADGSSSAETAIFVDANNVAPFGIAIDPEVGLIYWSEQGELSTGDIRVVGLEGQNPGTLVANCSTTPLGLSLDPILQKLYWADNDDDELRRVSTNGEDNEVILDYANSGITQPNGVFIDYISGYLYFNDDVAHPNGKIQRTKAPEFPIYDNANVTHAIPQSTLQYSWIKDSAETTRAEFQGYATGSDIQFYSSSIDFDDSPMNKVYIDPVNATQSFDFTGSVYTYNTWKEIRGGELGLSRYYRNHNILPITNAEDSTTQYIEPPVVAKHQPLDYNLAIDGTLTPYSIKSPYGNVLVRYSNDEINKLYDFRVSDKNTEYTKIKDLYLNKSITDAGNPVKAFYSLTYGETVYPQSKNAFMKKVRVRGEYTEVAGTGSSGYDRLYGTQNTFYSTTKQRTAGALNSQGYAPSTQIYLSASYVQNFAASTEWQEYSSQIARDSNSGIVRDPHSGSNCFVFGSQGQEQNRSRYLLFKEPIIGQVTMSFSAIAGPYSPLDLKGRSQALSSVAPLVYVAALSASNAPANSDLFAWSAANLNFSSTAPTTAFQEVVFKGYLSESYGPQYLAIVQDGSTFITHDDNSVAIKNLKITYTPVSSSLNFDAFQSMRSSKDKSFSQLETFNKNVGELNSDTDTSLSEKDFQIAMAFVEETSNRINRLPASLYYPATGSQVSLGYNENLVETISGKAPSALSYEEYAENEKILLKEASILPEFRMSEHIPYYVATHAGNFRETNKKFLTLLGSEQSSSADSYVSPTFNKSFEDTHLLTSDVENLKKIKNDHIGHSKLSKLTIRASGIKKLLAYNGFYPQSRTIQIGNELSSSLSSNITGYLYNSASFATGTIEPTENSRGYFGFLKTMASPGILYNSIKAGIAVDYPAFSAPPQLQTPSGFETFGDAKILAAPDVRLPFNSLYNLEDGLPKSTKIYPVFSGDKLTEKKDSQPFSFSWDGIKAPSYELAMHNFLAESVKFFLKGEQLNSFISGPENSFLEVAKDKKYYMDVVLDDQLHNNKFFNLKGKKDRFPNYANTLTSSLPENYDYGYDVDIVADHAGGCYMITGEPGNDESPGLRDSGKIYLHHIDSGGSVEMLYSDKPSGFGIDARFGESVTICSGSTGIYFGASAPTILGHGSVLYYKHVIGGATTVLTDTTTITATVTKFGAKIKALYDEAYSKVYFAILDATNSNGTNSIGIHLRHVPTATTTVQKDFETFFDKADAGTITAGWQPKDYLGLDLLNTTYTDPLDNRLHIAVSSQKYKNGTDLGAATLVLWNGPGSVSTELGPYLDPIDPTTIGYGSDISLVKTSTNDSTTKSYAYVAVGRGYLGSEPEQGSVALFSTPLDASFDLASSKVYNDNITSQGPASGNNIRSWGANVSLSLDPPTKDLFLAASDEYFAELNMGTNLGLVEVQTFAHKFGTGLLANNYFATGTLRNFIVPDFDDKLTMHPRFGSAMAADSTPDSYFIGTGSPAYSGSLSSGGISHLLYGTASYHDYRQDGKLFGFAIDGNYDPAYCAYTHPGYYGESTARITFSSSIGGPVTLEEIFVNAEIQDMSIISSDRTRINTGSYNSSFSTLQESAKMPFTASVALFERVQNPGMEFSLSADGTVSSPNRAVPSTKNDVRWAISTRYESPVIDVSSSLYSENYNTFNNRVSGTFPDLNTGTISYDTPQTIWTSYSSDRSSTKKFNFSLRESSFSTPPLTNTGSLIKLCGFTAATKNVGSLAETKQISEAIMVIPYTDRPISKKTIEIEKGKHFFRINQSELKRQKKTTEDSGYAISEEIPTTSITEMLSGMKDYVIPPSYNFLAYKDIKPFVAYFLEFEHTLNNEDLANIWQGISPSIAINPELDEVEISHDIDKHNLFHNIDIPNDIKFMVFKVKKKAEWNYYNITTDSTDDDRFRFDFQGNGQVEVVPEYSYNWPYDYFSLVERAKVAVDFTFKKPKEDE